jgi:hypothetical protein
MNIDLGEIRNSRKLSRTRSNGVGAGYRTGAGVSTFEPRHVTLQCEEGYIS